MPQDTTLLEQIISILLPVFGVVFMGFWVGKYLKPDLTDINRINIDVLLPALVFSSLVTMELEANQSSLLLAAFVAVLLPGVLMLGLCKFTALSFRTWAPPQMFRNSGNLAIPLFGYAFGESAMGAAVLLFVVSTVLHITLGLFMLSSKEHLSWKSLLKMPVMVAAVSALFFNLTHIEIWSPVLETTKLVGQAAVPIMLLALGVQLTKLRISGLKVGLISSVLSLITGAITFAVIYYSFTLTLLEIQMMVLFTMLPPAVMNYLFSERFNVKPEQVAAMVLYGNFFSLITLPILLAFAFALA